MAMLIATRTGWSMEYIEQFDYLTLNRIVRYLENDRRGEVLNLINVQQYGVLIEKGKGGRANKIAKKYENRIGYNGSGRSSNFVGFLLAHTNNNLLTPTE